MSTESGRTGDSGAGTGKTPWNWTWKGLFHLLLEDSLPDTERNGLGVEYQWHRWHLQGQREGHHGLPGAGTEMVPSSCCSDEFTVKLCHSGRRNSQSQLKIFWKNQKISILSVQNLLWRCEGVWSDSRQCWHRCSRVVCLGQDPQVPPRCRSL